MSNSMYLKTVAAVLTLSAISLAAEQNHIPQTAYTVTLTSGVTMELVGIAKHPSGAKQWWAPDGRRLEISFHAIPHEVIVTGGNPYEFLVKVAYPKQVAFKWKNIEGCTRIFDATVEDPKGQQTKGLHAVLAYMQRGLAETSINIGVATYEWATIAESNSNEDKNIVFSSPVESKEGTSISIKGEHEFTFDGERAVIAIDLNGKIYYGYNQPQSIKPLAATPEFYTFTKKPSQIQKYQLQILRQNPYEWVEFKNVSLRPGQKAKVETRIIGSNLSDPNQQPADPNKPATKSKTPAEEMVEKIHKAFGHKDSRPFEGELPAGVSLCPYVTTIDSNKPIDDDMSCWKKMVDPNLYPYVCAGASGNEITVIIPVYDTKMKAKYRPKDSNSVGAGKTKPCKLL